MNRETLDQIWDQMRQKYGIYLRVLESIPEDMMHKQPVSGMRTPAQLAVHTSGSIVRDIAQGVAKGEITADEAAEDDVAAGLQSKADVIRYVRGCWDQANRAAQSIGDEQLQAVVPTPWDMSFPGYVGISILSDEFMHHRGQLYTYVRACGVAPPFMYDFGANEPDFQPRG